MKKGIEDHEKSKEFYVSYLGSLFRSIRFGLDQAHGKAATISLNYLLENGGLLYNSETKKWSVDFDNFENGVNMLSSELLILLGNGDNTNVQTFFNKWAVISPELKTSLNLVSDIAIDVLPVRSINWD